MNWKRAVVAILMVLPLAVSSEVVSAAEKNPCASNPCGKNPCMKNPCGKNPCAKNPCGANPCAMKPKAIRKKAITDNAKLLEKGDKLWNDTKLGTSGLACGTCHPDGSGLKSDPFPKYIKMANDILTLDQMIGFCMMNPMKAKPLPWNSEKLTALATYAQTHGKGGEPVNPCAMKQPCGKKNPCAKNPCGMKNPCGKK